MANLGTLYVVSTPIGNLKEMTPRAIETLQKVEVIACEDTRETMRLCSHFSIGKTLLSCHEHNERFVLEKILSILKEGKDVALVSDAGYPGISDPGSYVIFKCIQEEVTIVVVSGPCAIINALVGSGLNTDHFYFHGFLPNKAGEREKILGSLQKRKETIIFYESPHRIVESLQSMEKVFQGRQVCVCRELTKKFEEYIRGTLIEVLKRIEEKPIKGEMVVVVEGNLQLEEVIISDGDIINYIDEMIQRGLSAKDAIKEVSKEHNLPKNEVYRVYHQEL